MSGSKTAYQFLMKVTDDLKNPVVKLKSGGFMDLSVEILDKQEKWVRVSMAHYFEQEGDLISDPDMEIILYTEFGLAFPAIITQQFGARQCIREIDGKPMIVNKRALKDMTSFLNQWVRNLKAQKFLKSLEVAA